MTAGRCGRCGRCKRQSLRLTTQRLLSQTKTTHALHAVNCMQLTHCMQLMQCMQLRKTLQHCPLHRTFTVHDHACQVPHLARRSRTLRSCGDRIAIESIDRPDWIDIAEDHLSGLRELQKFAETSAITGTKRDTHSQCDGNYKPFQRFGSHSTFGGRHPNR